MSFENDVFISYAHEDNQPVPPAEKGWVDLFEAALRAYLGKTAGDPPRIWRDPTLERTGDLDEHIRRHLLASAVLLCVVSRSYVRSRYCLEELNQFLTEFGDEQRIVKVVTASLPNENEHPPPLDHSLGYPFFELDERTRRTYPLDPDDEASKRIYRRMLYDLAREVAQRLEAINGPPPAAEPATAIVYLARTSFDLNEQREALRAELQRNRVRVFPDAPLPALAGDCESRVHDWLAQSSLAVHLIGKYGGGAPDGPRDESYVELQHRMAVQSAGPNLQRLLWIVSEPAAEDLDHVRFVQQLKNDPATYRYGDLVQGSFEEFKSLVLRRAAETAGLEVKAHRPVRVYLLYEPADEEAVAALDTALSKQGFEVRLPVFEGDDEARANDQTAALAETDWAVVYWGSESELWFNAAVTRIRKWQDLGRESEIRGAVCLAPPSNRRKERCVDQPRPEFVVSLLDGLTEPSLARLMEGLKGERI